MNKSSIILILLLSLSLTVLAGCQSTTFSSKGLDEPPEFPVSSTASTEPSIAEEPIDSIETNHSSILSESSEDIAYNNSERKPLLEYQPSEWQNVVARRKEIWTIEERILAAVEPFDISDCSVIVLNELEAHELLPVHTNLLCERYGALENVPPGTAFFVDATGSFYYWPAIQAENFTYGRYGWEDIGITGLPGMSYTIYYSGKFPMEGSLENTAIQIANINAPGHDIEPTEGFYTTWYNALQEEKAKNPILIGHDEAMDYILRDAGWENFERNIASDGTEYYTNGFVEIFSWRYVPAEGYQFMCYPCGTKDYTQAFLITVFGDGHYLREPEFQKIENAFGF